MAIKLSVAFDIFMSWLLSPECSVYVETMEDDAKTKYEVTISGQVKKKWKHKI